MARYYYERLSHRSATLLEREDSRHFAHSGAMLVFEAGPLGHADGGVDFEGVRAAIHAALPRVRRFRQKLRWIPIENHPVWVDDPEFNLDYHVRHTSLARPGTREQLRKLAARLQSQRLDRSRPLWECWVVEGLEGGRFALLYKMHTALAEGGEADILQAILSGDAEQRAEAPPAYRPRPVPTAAELVRDEVWRQARLPRRALAATARFFRSDSALHDLQRRAGALARAFGYRLQRLPDTPLDGTLGPHRRVDMLTVSLADARSVRSALGGSVQDVLLASLAGAVGRYLALHFQNPSTLDFRVAAPVSLATSEVKPWRVSDWIVELPIWESDPKRRHARVRERTARLREEQPVQAARTLFDVAEWTSSRWLARGARGLQSDRRAHLRLVNVPGPQSPRFLKGARLRECYGLVPLAGSAGLGVSVISYDGQLGWGLNADYDLVPDLHVFTQLLEESFRELVGAVRASSLSLVHDASA